jgi:hypothetical protein
LLSRQQSCLAAALDRRIEEADIRRLRAISCAPATAAKTARARRSQASPSWPVAAARTRASQARLISAKRDTSTFTGSGRSSYSADMKLHRHYTGQRLARWLRMAHDRAEVDACPITHEAISAMLGMRRAGVANAAAVLWWAEVFAYSRGHVVIRDRPALEALACECYRHFRLGEDRLLWEPGEAERLAS